LTVYEKSLKISKVVIKVPTQLTNCVGTLITALDIFKLFSYTVTTTNCVGTLITALDKDIQSGNQGSHTVCCDCIWEQFEDIQSGNQVPTQLVVVTVYEKSLKISKAGIKVPTHCAGTLITALVIFKLFSYTVTTNCVVTLITALDIFKLFSSKTA
jgi:hypothetical protein